MEKKIVIKAENLNELIKLLGTAKKQAKQLQETLNQINSFQLKTISTFDD